MNALEMLGDWANQLFGLQGKHAGKSGLHHNLNQLLDMNTSGSLLGSIFHSEGGFLAQPERTYKHWVSQLQGGGNTDDGDDDRSSASTLLTNGSGSNNNIVTTDDGLTGPTPLAGDVQMSSYLAQKRRKIGNKKGRVDTMLTRGQDIADVENRMMLS